MKFINKVLSRIKISSIRLKESNFDLNIGINRKQIILKKIKPNLQEGLEIGPLCNPIVTKNEGNGRVWYVDLVSTEELKDKYRNDPNVFLKNIVNVDFILGKHSLSELLKSNFYDYVIASHVIEHVPDMISWINEIGEVLKDKGIFSLVIPDKRYSFDYLRELSSPGMIIEAFLRHQRQPRSREIFDHLASACVVDVISAWNGTIDKTSLIHYHNLQLAFDKAKDGFITEHYHDVHVNTFTPESFLNLLEIFVKLNLFDFDLVDFYDTIPNTLEFFVCLERIPRNSNRDKHILVQLDCINRARKRLNKQRS